MPKVTLDTLANLDNPPSATSVINVNFQRLQEVIDTLVSRDGASPNSMLAFLDMNGNRILNLPPPTSDQEPARHGDIQQYVDRAETAADEAELAQEITEGLAEDVVEAHEDFLSRYLGDYTDDPSVDPNGNPVTNGALYFNTTVNQWRVFVVDNITAGGDNVVAGSDNVAQSIWVELPMTTLRSLTDVDADVMVTGQILVWNNGAGTFTAEDNSAENTTFDPDGTMFNGSDVQAALEEVSSRTSLGIYDIYFWMGGLFGNGETLFNMVASREFTLPVGLVGSQCVARLPSAADVSILIKKNGSQIGTVDFSTGNTVASFTVAGDTVFSAGDLLTLEAPDPADTNLRDVSLTLAARR